MNTYKLTAIIDYAVLGIAAISAAAGATDLAVLGVIIHLTFNKLSHS